MATDYSAWTSDQKAQGRGVIEKYIKDNGFTMDAQGIAKAAAKAGVRVADVGTMYGLNPTDTQGWFSNPAHGGSAVLAETAMPEIKTAANIGVGAGWNAPDITNPSTTGLMQSTPALKKFDSLTDDQQSDFKAAVPTVSAPPVPASVATNATASAGYTPAQAEAVKATSKGYDAAQWSVTDDQTVSGRLAKLLDDPNSTLNVQSTAAADRSSNRRGLMNSSIGLSAAQDAAYKNALPIAQQDASTSAAAGQTNTGATNTARAFTAGAANTAELQNANLGTGVNVQNSQAENQMKAQRAGAETSVSINNSGLSTDVSKYNSGLIQSNSQFNAAATNTAALTGAQLTNQKTIAEMGNATQLQLQQIQSNTALTGIDKQTASQQLIANNENTLRTSLATIQKDTTISVADKQIASQQLIANNDNLIRTHLAQLQADTSISVADKQTAMQETVARLNTSTQLSISTLETTTRLELTQIDVANKKLLQGSAAASSYFNQSVTAIANIQMNKDMGPTAKTMAISGILAQTKAGLKDQEAITGIKVGDNFGGIEVGDTTTPPGTTAPSPGREPISDYDAQGNYIGGG